MLNTVLLISNSRDIHADAIANRLAVRDVASVRLNVDAYPAEEVWTLERQRNSKSTRISRQVPAESIDFSEVTSVLLRRPASFGLDSSLSPEIAAFVADESKASLIGLWDALADKRWISPYTFIRDAENKLRQLRIAASIGFKTPRTIVTNNPKDAAAFCAEVSEVITKAIHRGAIQRGSQVSIMRTSVVNTSHLTELQRVRHCPSLLQEYVPKAYELRITVVGTLVFACRIDSQDSPETRVDWRNYAVQIPYSATDLPDTVKLRCVALVNHLGLHFGAIDMVVTPDGDYVFLEINPAGQWLWIEERTGLRITEALVDLLVDGHTGKRES